MHTVKLFSISISPMMIAIVIVVVIVIGLFWSSRRGKK
jgi:nitrogen fixation-related uncharacterized protein